MPTSQTIDIRSIVGRDISPFQFGRIGPAMGCRLWFGPLGCEGRILFRYRFIGIRFLDSNGISRTHSG